ncbi:MAG: HEAT repeat domain-containing protein [Candidatus Omnitrophica bacterium]|nr:HEAT repeat domain-containing protein [Candidatus Omnitrophota bacterium]
MEQQLDELRAKEKKLIFLFGETMYHLYKSQSVRFLYTSAGEEQEKEVTKLVRLLDYIEDRIAKLEELYAAEEEDEEEDSDEEETEEEVVGDEEELSEAETVESEAAEIETEKTQNAEPEKSDDVVSLAEQLLVPDKEEQLNWVAPNVAEIIEQEPEPIKETVAVAVEEIKPVEVEAVKPVEPKDVLEHILKTAEFVSDVDKRLFEKNIKQLKKGTEREREISVGQIAHTLGNEDLKKVYEFVMKDSSLMVRQAVMKNISRMKDNEMEGFWELGLNDPDLKVRTTAIKGIGTHVTEAHRTTLEVLLKDSEPHVRGLAVTYLGMYYGKEGVRKAVTSWLDQSPYVRTSLIEMLSIVKPEGALTTIKNLLSDTDEDVKKQAEKALKKIMPERKKESNHDKRKK